MTTDRLTFFDPWEHIKIHGTRVPHWQQSGATCFVTFRLADSLPTGKLKLWKQEREDWLKHNPKPWTDVVEADYHRRFSGPIDRWLDQGHGACELRRPALRLLLSETLLHSDGERYALHSFVLMPNHAHLLFSLAPDQELERTVQVWKGVSARRINRLRARVGENFWMKGYFDRLIRDADHFRNVARYIRTNPQKAHLAPTDCTLHESPMVKELLEP